VTEAVTETLDSCCMSLWFIVLVDFIEVSNLLGCDTVVLVVSL